MENFPSTSITQKGVLVKMNQIYKKDEFIIFPVRSGYIAVNTKGEFKDNHTHLKHFNATKKAINLVIGKKIPRSNSFYYLNSLKRLSLDQEYKDKITSLIKVKKQKGKQVYRNRKG